MNIKYHLKESLCVYGGPNRVAGGDDGEKEGGGRDGGRRSGTEYVTCMILTLDMLFNYIMLTQLYTMYTVQYGHQGRTQGGGEGSFPPPPPRFFKFLSLLKPWVSFSMSILFLYTHFHYKLLLVLLIGGISLPFL